MRIIVFLFPYSSSENNVISGIGGIEIHLDHLGLRTNIESVMRFLIGSQ